MKRRAIGAALLLCLLAGCCTTEISTDQPAYGKPARFTSHQFLWGLVGGHVHTSGRLSRVEVYKGVGNYILTVLTVGLYSPWSASVWYSETTK